jgi:hypothetical protein
MNLCPGDVLAMRYKVKRRIGGGSFGEIYLGRQHTFCSSLEHHNF